MVSLKAKKPAAPVIRAMLGKWTMHCTAHETLHCTTNWLLYNVLHTKVVNVDCTLHCTLNWSIYCTLDFTFHIVDKSETSSV